MGTYESPCKRCEHLSENLEKPCQINHSTCIIPYLWSRSTHDNMMMAYPVEGFKTEPVDSLGRDVENHAKLGEILPEHSIGTH